MNPSGSTGCKESVFGLSRPAQTSRPLNGIAIYAIDIDTAEVLGEMNRSGHHLNRSSGSNDDWYTPNPFGTPPTPISFSARRPRVTACLAISGFCP